jgi:hypothetical protein
LKSTVKKEVDRALAKRVERKVKWWSQDEASISTLSQGNNFQDVITIAEGTGAEERVGKAINLTGIHLKGVLKNNGASCNYVRMVLFRYMLPALTVDSTEGFFENSIGSRTDFTSIPGLNTIYTPFNSNNVKVIWTKVFKLASNSSVEGNDTAMFNMFKKLPNLKIEYEGPNTGNANVQPRLWLGVWAAESPDDTSTGQNVEISYVGRTFYTDM